MGADRGVAAQEKVAVRMENVPKGYHRFHDVDFNGFNID